MSNFSARAYWEERLEADWSLRGVGFRRMGRRFNEQAYLLRGKRFRQVIEDFIPESDRRDVLDVGSGTGFYLDAWKRLGADGLVGMDFSEAAVLNLRRRFPELRIEQADITSVDLELDEAGFGVVSCMDVLFHVVDNPGFRAALENVRALLKPGGYFVWSDLFIHGRELTRNHISWRNIYRIEEILERVGFDIIARRPMFFWMNEPRRQPASGLMDMDGFDGGPVIDGGDIRLRGPDSVPDRLRAGPQPVGVSLHRDHGVQEALGVKDERL